MCQNFRSLALTVWDLWCFEDLEEKDDPINQSVNVRGVCRTAPATPGLFNRKVKDVFYIDSGLKKGHI